eukprot:11263928-Alexandrium_andersonii.AAC.1
MAPGAAGHNEHRTDCPSSCISQPEHCEQVAKSLNTWNSPETTNTGHKDLGSEQLQPQQTP